MVEFVLAGILLPLVVLGFTEAIVKPIAVKLTQKVSRAVLSDVFYRLDSQLILPEQWELFLKDNITYLKSVILPEFVDTYSLDADQVEEIVLRLKKEFDLEKFLGKVNP